MELKDMLYTCTDLEDSLFLAPDEIRACCKRFFKDGKMRGDVVLLKLHNKIEALPLLKEIFAAKAGLKMQINKGLADTCCACPHLELRPKAPMFVRKISYEQTSVCNLRCSYCSPTYYGGKKPSYDAYTLSKELLSAGYLDELGKLIFGGGEPTLEPSFAPMMRLVRDLPSALKHAVNVNVITNGTNFSTELARTLSEDKAYITTSLDAGTRATYKAIRGANRLEEVLDNLAHYASYNASAIIIKYILLKDNIALGELDAFVSELQAHGLTNTALCISVDFNLEVLPSHYLFALCYLFARALEAGFNIVYLDELLRSKIKVSEEEFRELLGQLEPYGLARYIFAPSKGTRYFIVGGGINTRYILENSGVISGLIEDGQLLGVLDDTNASFSAFGLKTLPLNSAMLPEYKDTKLLVQGVQSTIALHKKLLELGIDGTRIELRLIL